MPSTKLIVVTGSNRGIGQGIIQLLAKTQHNSPMTIYATSRSGADLGIHAQNGNEVRYSKLDVGNKDSIRAFLRSSIQGHQPIDVLINNAGVNNNNRETPELAAETIDVNYCGTKNMCGLFLGEGGMADVKGSRIVNVSSTASQLSNYDSSIQQRFHAVKSIADVDHLAKSYSTTLKQSPEAQKESGWGAAPRSYQVSKALMNALTVVLAKQSPDVMINCCCPGWVDSDMGNQIGRPPKTLEEGARIPVRLAIGDLGPSGDCDGALGQGTEKISGRYFGNDGVSDRGWGKVRKW
ncbi:NAD(P)-binding protein [Setomelanomma holmii]|uniref:NAD(P)-binding protein n=1 Tax=Setomelanomma holmii TaxID=210430 RepID=A0A9P4H8G4_9PLEO|nr:NAD(P)-binding protein [Setomelanomma holmii]